MYVLYMSVYMYVHICVCMCVSVFVCVAQLATPLTNLAACHMRQSFLWLGDLDCSLEWMQLWALLGAHTKKHRHTLTCILTYTNWNTHTHTDSRSKVVWQSFWVVFSVWCENASQLITGRQAHTNTHTHTYSKAGYLFLCFFCVAHKAGRLGLVLVLGLGQCADILWSPHKSQMKMFAFYFEAVGDIIQ